ncbi:hypothetical protein ACFQ5Q_15640 [Luteolibacter ambystomatis]
MKWPLALIACLALASCDKTEVASLKPKSTEEASIETPRSEYKVALVAQRDAIGYMESCRRDLADLKEGKQRPSDINALEDRERFLAEAESGIKESALRVEKCREAFLKSSPSETDVSNVQNFASELQAAHEEYLKQVKAAHDDANAIQFERMNRARERYYSVISKAAASDYGPKRIQSLPPSAAR